MRVNSKVFIVCRTTTARPSFDMGDQSSYPAHYRDFFYGSQSLVCIAHPASTSAEVSA